MRPLFEFGIHPRKEKFRQIGRNELIFLPLRNYAKSILVRIKKSKSVISKALELMNFDFMKFVLF